MSLFSYVQEACSTGRQQPFGMFCPHMLWSWILGQSGVMKSLTSVPFWVGFCQWGHICKLDLCPEWLYGHKGGLFIEFVTALAANVDQFGLLWYAYTYGSWRWGALHSSVLNEVCPGETVVCHRVTHWHSQVLGSSSINISSVMIKIFQTYRWQFVQHSKVPKVTTF